MLYLVRPSLRLMRQLAEHLKRLDQSSKGRKSISVYFVPRNSALCEDKLKHEGVHGSVSHFGEYRLDLIPFEQVHQRRAHARWTSGAYHPRA